ncbi:MAG: DUF6585 family protein [Chloroflexota bacterium]
MTRQPESIPMAAAGIGEDIVEFRIKQAGDAADERGFQATMALLVLIVTLAVTVLAAGVAGWGLALPVLIFGAILTGAAFVRQRAGQRLDTDVTRVLAGEHGLAIEHARGDIQLVLWENLDAVYEDAHVVGQVGKGQVRTETQQYAIVTQDGRRIHLPGALQQLPVLGARLKQAVETHLLPRAQASLERGEPVPFGLFNLTSDGLARDGETLPWSSVDRVALRGQAFAVFRQGDDRPWLLMETARIPNRTALHVLLNRSPLDESRIMI